MKGNQVCKDAKIILNQMIDLQVELLQPTPERNNSEQIKTKVGP